MRFSYLLILFMAAGMSVLTAGSADAQRLDASKVAIKVSNGTLKAVFAQVEKQTEFRFVFNNGSIGENRKINFTIQGNLEQALKALASMTETHYEQSGKNIVVTYQRKPVPAKIKGQVTSAKGEPLPGATIRIKETGRSFVTDANGQYDITLAAGIYTLEASYISFSREIKEGIRVDEGSSITIDFKLKDGQDNLNEVVVVGYRTQKKATLTGAVSTIDMSSKGTETLTNSTQAFYGAQGVWVNQAGAKPGIDGATIRIRGVNTLSGANPLVLLDGVEYDLVEIDPENIETITVLKDASAAIYGSRSANGVILLTSKKGKKGKPTLEYRTHTGLQHATYLPDVVDDPILYMQMRNRAEINSGKASGTYTEQQIEEYRKGMEVDPSVYPATNWFDIALDRGSIQQHNLRASGGNDQVTYSLGAGYMKQKGIIYMNDDASRYSLDMKLSAQITPRLKVSGSLTGNMRKFNEVGYGTGTVMSVIMRGLPIISDYHRNNVYGSTWLYTPGRNNIENPRMEVEQGFIKRDYQEFLSNINVDYQLPFGIRYNGIYGYRKVDHWSKDFIPMMYTVNPKTGDIREFNPTAAPRVKDWDAYNAQYSISHRLTWEKLLHQKHLAHVMFGQDYQVNDNRNFQAYNVGFYDNSLQELNALKDQTRAQATGGSSLDKLASYYSRLAYTYNDKYLLEVTLRMDGSSRFAPGNEWGFFPSVSAGWIISEEKFFHRGSVSHLKLRASVGKLGNQAVSIGSYNSKVVISNAYNYSFGGGVAGGAAVAALNDRNIKWESTMSYNGGIDLEAFRSRLSFTGDVFYKRTYDILRAVGIPSQVGGLQGPTLNLGTVDNKGYEVALSWKDNIKKFSYGLNASLTYVKNEVVDINGEEKISGRYIIKEGYSINSYYLYQSLGYFQSQDEIDKEKAVYGTRSKIRPGYVKYANQNDDTYIDDQDKIVTGNTIPSYTFAFGANVGYRNFMLEAQFQGVANVDVYPTGNVAFPFNNGAGVTYDWATDSWSETNRNAKNPLLTTYTDAGENFINSTQWLHDASYIRMKNISLSYRLPQSFCQKLKINRISVYASAQNLWTISNFKMWDPEMTVTRGDLYEYPNLKTMSCGIDVTF